MVVCGGGDDCGADYGDGYGGMVTSVIGAMMIMMVSFSILEAV